MAKHTVSHLSIAMNLPALPEIGANGLPQGFDKARLPAVYERATQALAECSRLDECKDWADKAAALASYFKQSNDKTMFKMATRIQVRAIRRGGELLKQFGNEEGGRPIKNHIDNDMVLTRTEAAEKAGMNKRQKVTALRVASVPAVEFEAMVESESPPTVTQLAEQGKATKPQPLHDLEGIDPEQYRLATELRWKVRFLAEFCQEQEPAAIAGAFKLKEKPEIKQHIAIIESWLDRFVVII